MEYTDNRFLISAKAILAALTKETSDQVMRKSIKNLSASQPLHNFFSEVQPKFVYNKAVPKAPWIVILGCGPAPDFIAVKVMVYVQHTVTGSVWSYFIYEANRSAAAPDAS